VAVLLFVANWLVPWLWRRGHDPDNFSIPFLTAVGDLVGGMLLALTFHLLYVMSDAAVVSPDHN
jgi:solute carrier family 41